MISYILISSNWRVSYSLNMPIKRVESNFTGILHFIAPCFTVLYRYHVFLFFYKSKVCGNTESNKSISVTVFPTVFARFISLFSTLVILTVFQALSLLYLWCDYYNCLGELWTAPIQETGNLIDMCVLTTLLTSHLSPSPLTSSIPRNTAVLKLGQ